MFSFELNFFGKSYFKAFILSSQLYIIFSFKKVQKIKILIQDKHTHFLRFNLHAFQSGRPIFFKLSFKLSLNFGV
jgi:hypothetical protein